MDSPWRKKKLVRKKKTNIILIKQKNEGRDSNNILHLLFYLQNTILDEKTLRSLNWRWAEGLPLVEPELVEPKVFESDEN